MRGRSYPWGTVNIEERQHCDFQALRTLVLAHHMQVQEEEVQEEDMQEVQGRRCRRCRVGGTW